MPEHTLLPSTTYPAIVGRLLAEERRTRGMKQDELASSIGIQQSALSKLERGEVPLTVEQLALAAEMLDTTPGQILRNADRVAAQARTRGIHVAPRAAREAISSGWVLIGALALGALVLAVLTAAAADQTEP